MKAEMSADQEAWRFSFRLLLMFPQ